LAAFEKVSDPPVPSEPDASLGVGLCEWSAPWTSINTSSPLLSVSSLRTLQLPLLLLLLDALLLTKSSIQAEVLWH
jgi:hypothetical protein